MFKALLHHFTRKMERQMDYDAGYMHEIIDTSSGAALRLSMLSLMSQYDGGGHDELWAGAAIASTLDGDCGPCAQLIIDTAISKGVSEEVIRACLQRNFEQAGAAGLGFRYAEAAISGDPVADDLRAEIETAYGKKAVLAAAYAAATGRAWPVLKRAMGHGAACQRLKVGDDLEQIAPRAA